MIKQGLSRVCVCSSVLFQRQFRGKDQNGFTLIEMMVVMGIIALIFALGATSMMGAERQTRLRDAAKTLQSDIRLAANNSISVAPDMNDPSKPAKAWSLYLVHNKLSYGIQDYYGDASPLTRTYSSPVVPGGNIKFYITEPADMSDGTSIYLVFSSPFAKFKVIRGMIGSWTKNSVTGEFIPNPGPGSLVINTGNIKIRVTDDISSYYVIINPVTGESSISNN